MTAEYNPKKIIPRQPADAADNSQAEDDTLWTLLSVYLDGEATPAEAAQVESLLRDNPAYARDFAWMRAASETTRRTPEVMPPAYLRQAILSATTQRQTAGSRLAAAWSDFRAGLWPAFARLALPVGTVAAAGIVAILLWPHTNETKPRSGATLARARTSQIATSKSAVKGARTRFNRANPTRQMASAHPTRRTNRSAPFTSGFDASILSSLLNAQAHPAPMVQEAHYSPAPVHREMPIAPLSAFVSRHPQIPRVTDDASSTVQVASAYTTTPHMDDLNVRAQPAMMSVSDDSDNDASHRIVSADIVSIKGDSTAGTNPSAATSVGRQQSKRLMAQLPPDAPSVRERTQQQLRRLSQMPNSYPVGSLRGIESHELIAAFKSNF